MINILNSGLESDRVEVCSIEPATFFWISKELRNISRRKCENKFLIFVHSQIRSQTSPNIQELALVQSTDYGTNYRHFKCAFCLKVLEKPDVLISREWIHTDYRPHVCDIRGKTFAAKDSISVHIPTHELIQTAEGRPGIKFVLLKNIYPCLPEHLPPCWAICHKFIQRIFLLCSLWQ